MNEFFGDLCTKSKFSDVTFIVGKDKKKIPAHRLV